MLQFINDFINSQGYYYFYSAILQTFAALCSIIFIGLFFRFQIGAVIEGLENIRGYNPTKPGGGFSTQAVTQDAEKSQKNFFRREYKMPFFLSCLIMFISIIMLFMKSCLNLWIILIVTLTEIVLILFTFWRLYIFVDLCLKYKAEITPIENEQ